MQTTLESTPPQDLMTPTVPYPEKRDISAEALGKEAVEVQERLEAYGSMAERAENLGQRVNRLRTEKVHPTEVGFLGRKFAKFTGKLMTVKEVMFIPHAEYQNSLKEGHEYMAASEKKQLQPLLEEVRRELSAFGTDVVSSFLISMYCSGVPESLREAKRQASKAEESWSVWLGSNAGDEHLLEFLKWHVDKIEQLQKDPERQHIIEPMRQSYKEAVTQGITDGWLHTDGQSAVQTADGVKFYRGDIFDLMLKDRKGYHVFGTDTVVIGGNPPRHNIYHELEHYDLVPMGPRWKMEAEVEHIAQTLDNGSPEIMDPTKRDEENGSEYIDERILYAAVLRGYKNKRAVPVRLATRAASESADSHAAKDEFESAVNEAWSDVLPEGSSVFNCLTKYIANLEDEFLKQKKNLNDAEVLALRKAHEDLIRQPENIFGAKEKASFRQPEKAAALRNMTPDVASLMIKLLAHRQGYMRVSQPPRPVAAPEVIADVNTEIKELRAEGKSERIAYRTLAKKYHSDVNNDPEAEEKMRVVTEGIDRLNHEVGQKLKQAEAMGKKVAA